MISLNEFVVKRKSEYIALLNYFKMRYNFSPAIAEQLVQDVLRIIKVLNPDSLKEGQILRYVVSNTEPPGKTLKDCKLVLVKLTLHTPQDIEYRKRNGLKELKLKVIQRITREAFNQGGSLSQEDIADILFLDRRTVVDYIKELESRGIQVITRAKLPKIKGKPASKSRVIRMFLEGMEEEEIANRTYHNIIFIKRWIEEFLQTHLFYHWGTPVYSIPKITGIQPDLVREYLEIYNLLTEEKQISQNINRFFSFYEKINLLEVFKQQRAT